MARENLALGAGRSALSSVSSWSFKMINANYNDVLPGFILKVQIVLKKETDLPRKMEWAV